LNVCPVYERVGGQAYESVYPGPIGAILTPQLRGLGEATTLPWASSLCGACYEVCPVKIDIPTVLLHLRAKAVEHAGATRERALMRAVSWFFGSRTRFETAERLGRWLQRPLVRRGAIRRLPPPLSGWTRARDLRPVEAENEDIHPFPRLLDGGDDRRDAGVGLNDQLHAAPAELRSKLSANSAERKLVSEPQPSPTSESDADADVHQPRRADRRGIRLDEIHLVEQVLRAEEHLQAAADIAQHREVERCIAG